MKLHLFLIPFLFVGTVLVAAPVILSSIVSPQDAVQGVKQTIKGGPTVFSQDGDYGGDGTQEPPSAALDGDTGAKYLNKAQDGTKDPGVDSGLLITPKKGSTIVTAFQFYTGNDMPERDPLTVTLEGSNDPTATKEGCKNFTLIYQGTGGLDNDPDRGNSGVQVTFPNTTAYTTYRLLVTKTRATTDGCQFGEFTLFGTKAP